MDLEAIRAKAKSEISPLISVNKISTFLGCRTDAGRSLPAHYLVYFLLVDLLGFKNIGRSEKISWSLPVEINGTLLFIEHRKSGLGIFAESLETDEAAAEEAARRIHAGVKAAQPYFEMLADEAAKGSSLNVKNNERALFNRFTYFAECYEKKSAEAEARKGDFIETELPNNEGVSSTKMLRFPSYQLNDEALWYATAAIEAFYSWTEHVFILVAILQGKIATGEDVAKIAQTEWKEKFKLVLKISSSGTKQVYDRLLALRNQVRNFFAHGAFGKNGEALSFHSSVGAVPLILPYRKNVEHFRFGNEVDFLAPEAMKLINEFKYTIWAGKLSPARIYIESGLPLILLHAADGTYAQAMISDEKMIELTDRLNEVSDIMADMDW